MPGSNGPCRFGMYRQLHQMVLDRLGEGGRVGIWSPPDSDYFEGVPPGLGAIVLGGVAALRHARRRAPRRAAGGADPRRGRRDPRALVAAAVRDGRARGGGGPLREEGHDRGGHRPRSTASATLVAGFARELRAVKDPRPHPTVLLVGEIYVRSDPASNGWAADELERRGIRVRIEPVVEYLQFSDLVQLRRGVQKGLKAALKSRHPQADRGRHPATPPRTGMGWPHHAPIADGRRGRRRDYLRQDLEHEAVLALGLGAHGWRSGELDGAPLRRAARVHAEQARRGAARPRRRSGRGSSRSRCRSTATRSTPRCSTSSPTR